MNELLKSFINRTSGFTTPIIDEVTSYKENGYNEYKVECKMISGTIKTCLVNKIAFMASQHPVKWLK